MRINSSVIIIEKNYFSMILSLLFACFCVVLYRLPFVRLLSKSSVSLVQVEVDNPDITIVVLT